MFIVVIILPVLVVAVVVVVLLLFSGVVIVVVVIIILFFTVDIILLLTISRSFLNLPLSHSHTHTYSVSITHYCFSDSDSIYSQHFQFHYHSFLCDAFPMSLTSERWWIYNNLYCTNTLNLNVLCVCCVHKFVYLISFCVMANTRVHCMPAKWCIGKQTSFLFGLLASFFLGSIYPPLPPLSQSSFSPPSLSLSHSLSKLKFFSTHFSMVLYYTFKLFESVCYLVV